ncbi:hypothetical protein BV25DRAFT_948512 [Artomyces pyxidatus]|uniref:Uncharacterized protein n=1 Tax=Artomyces pyxidatus TaxID=48021 RepID=A0ACB8SVW4_9AGAM|nr:hypothetical protein BV25DRAFT_948512 [Artomyces pyxidatus]
MSLRPWSMLFLLPFTSAKSLTKSTLNPVFLWLPSGSSMVGSGITTFQCMSGDTGLGLGHCHSLGHIHGLGHSHGHGRLVPWSFVAPGHDLPFECTTLLPMAREEWCPLSVTALKQWYKFQSVMYGTSDAAGLPSVTHRLLLFVVRSFLLLTRKFHVMEY